MVERVYVCVIIILVSDLSWGGGGGQQCMLAQARPLMINHLTSIVMTQLFPCLL